MSGITGWDIVLGFPAFFFILVLLSIILDVVFENFGQLLWNLIVISSFGYLFWRFS